MSRVLLDGDHPPDWCFRANGNGDLPTCTYVDGQWHRSYDGGGFGGAGGDGGFPSAFVALFVLAVVAGIALTFWRVSTARRMARDSGMSEGDATAMTLLSDDGFEATYLASNLRVRPPADPVPPAPPVPAGAAARLRELEGLLADGLISQAEHDARRQVIIDSV